MTFEEIMEAIPQKPYFRDEQADIVIYCADCRDIDLHYQISYNIPRR